MSDAVDREEVVTLVRAALARDAEAFHPTTGVAPVGRGAVEESKRNSSARRARIAVAAAALLISVAGLVAVVSRGGSDSGRISVRVTTPAQSQDVTDCIERESGLTEQIQSLPGPDGKPPATLAPGTERFVDYGTRTTVTIPIQQYCEELIPQEDQARKEHPEWFPAQGITPSNVGPYVLNGHVRFGERPTGTASPSGSTP